MDAFALGGTGDKLRRAHEALADVGMQMKFNAWPGLFTADNVGSGYLGDLADAILASENLLGGTS